MARLGLKGVEAHYPTEINEENLHLYQQLEKETGIRLVGIGPSLSIIKILSSGRLNPTPINKKKLPHTVNTLKLVKAAARKVWDCGRNRWLHDILRSSLLRLWERYENVGALDEVRCAGEHRTQAYEPAPTISTHHRDG
jgi:hypothetical protein